MFVTNELIYIQMQKTGCTHIASLLSKLFTGEQIGKHNKASDAQINSDKYFISSIRNPWDWYLSLWTYGVQGRGGLKERLTTKNYPNAILSTLKNPLNNYFLLKDEITKDISIWTETYVDHANVESFRRWLKLMHTPENSRWLGEGYGRTSIADVCGFMTYRYLYLCCAKHDVLYRPGLISNYNDLYQYDKDECYIDYFIRQESLEENFFEAIEQIKPLKLEEKNEILNEKKTNTSKRHFSTLDYYNDESIELIYNRDKLIIDKFNYASPK